MKNLILLILCSIVFSCGVRTKKTTKEKEQISTNEKIDKSEDLSVKSYSESKTDLSQYLNDIGLKINSVGKLFTLQYNGFVFSGDADIDFSKKESKTVVNTINRTETTYKSITTHKSVITYKSEKSKKESDLKSERPSWWLYVLISFASVVIGIYVWENYIRNLKIFRNGKTIDTQF